MSRLPVRLRLTLAFALAMAFVLSAVGAILYVRLGNSLQEQLDDSLEGRMASLTLLVKNRGDDLARPALGLAADEGFAQLLSAEGSVVVSPRRLADDPLISPAEADRAREGPFFLRRESFPGQEKPIPVRLHVDSVKSQGETFVIVVGASLEDREEALSGLLAQLFIVGPLALVLSSLAGYFLGAAALRPVEAMRRQAADISTEQLGRRLPLPRARDEIRRLGETLNAMLGRLQAGLERERRFVADASHELRTPLALLQTELELALRRPRSPQELELAVRSAAEEVDRLARLAEDLLVLARADEGRLPLRRAPIDAEELLETVARRFAPRAAQNGRALEVAALSDEAIVGDRIRLEQALGNLVDNALRHGAGTIFLEAERQDGAIAFRVSDEGPGFAPDFLPRAFERFARADEARGGGTAGLGLAIVDAIVRAHGGTAQVANRNGAGAVVSLTFPTAEATRTSGTLGPIARSEA